jgi:transposase
MGTRPDRPGRPREHLAGWLTRFDPVASGSVAFATEGCTGWRYIAEEMAEAAVIAHLAEPADTSLLRIPRRRAKTGDLSDRKMVGRAQGRRPLGATRQCPRC